MKLTFTLGIIAIGIIVLFIVSCKPKGVIDKSGEEKKPTESTAKPAITPKEKECMPITVDPAFMKNNGEGKFVKIKSAIIDGDCLELLVNHAGGCPKRPDVYTLVWNKKILKSYPPQVVLNLHLESEDLCKKLIQKKIKFDLNEIHSANPKGKVFVRVKGIEEKLLYEFVNTEDK